MRDDALDMPQMSGPRADFQRYFDSDNDVLRSAAVKALRSVLDPRELRDVLAAFLLDPDPDVRTDAMEIFADTATVENADVLRRSLEGDPVREVKLAAIAGLTRLRDAGSVDLFRALVLSRSEDRVAWEDEDSDWEDWLDVQLAAIDAIGEMGVQDAVGELFAAREDEFGQSLDIRVFAALGRIGPEGVDYLLAIIETESGLSAKRAADALGQISPQSLARHADTLIGSDSAMLRCLGLRALPGSDDRAPDLVTADPDPEVRRAALSHFAPHQPDLAQGALGDADSSVQAAALDLLVLPDDPKARADLADNMLAWIDNAPDDLMIASVRLLPRVAPERAVDPLLALIGDDARALLARVTAVKALGAPGCAVATVRLGALLSSPVQQVRAATLAILADRAQAGDEQAISRIAAAIAGDVFAEEDAVLTPRDGDAAPDLAVSKAEGAGRQSIHITPEGEIIRIDASEEESGDVVSTLASIQHVAEPEFEPVPEQAGDTPEESTSKRRRRRAVEGPDEVADALTVEALQTASVIGTPEIARVILSRLTDGHDAIRRVAWQAMARLGPIALTGDDLSLRVDEALKDDDAVVRLAAVQIRLAAGGDDGILQEALADDDPLIRAAAVETLPADPAVGYLGDKALGVRNAALRRVLDDPAPERMLAAFDRLLQAERADTLALFLAASADGFKAALNAVADTSLDVRKAFVILTALAGMPGRVAAA